MDKAIAPTATAVVLLLDNGLLIDSHYLATAPLCSLPYMLYWHRCLDTILLCSLQFYAPSLCVYMCIRVRVRVGGWVGVGVKIDVPVDATEAMRGDGSTWLLLRSDPTRCTRTYTHTQARTPLLHGRSSSSGIQLECE